MSLPPSPRGALNPFDDPEATARAWYDALHPAQFVRDDPAVVQSQLAQLLARLIDLFHNDPYAPDEARAVGRSLVPLCADKPRALSRTQHFLVQQLGTTFPTDQALALQPRLATLLADLALGFFEAQAQEAQAVSRRVLRNMGHSLHSWLNIIIGYTRLLMRGLGGPLTDQQHTDIAAVYEAGTMLQQYIDQLLNLAKIESGVDSLGEQSVDVAALLDNVAAEVQPLLTQNESRLSISVADHVGTIRSDEALLRYLLGVLLRNAARFTVRGHVRLAATRDDGSQTLLLIVADDGLGMTPARLRAILSPSESDVSTTNTLSLCRRLCQLLGGSLQAESEVGRGSTFTLHLPVAD